MSDSKILARQIISELAISKPAVSLERIAKHLKIQIRYSPLDNELSGMAVIKDGEAIIGVNSLHHPNRQRFTIAHEIGHPLNNEYAICAITESGERVCSEIGLCGVDESWIEFESKVQQKEVCRRLLEYKGNEASVSAGGKIAILVDDGISTGLTMKAAILAIKKQKPRKIIVAVPMATHDRVVEFGQLVDEVVVLIESYYIHFSEVSDKEAQVALHQIKTIHNELVTV